MDYTEHTHCPNCFQPSFKAVCPSCFFDRNSYLQQEAASHHLPLFMRLDKGYVLGRVIGEGSFAIVYAAIREKDGLMCAVKEYYPQDLAQRGLDGITVNPKRNQAQLNTWQERFIQEGELLRCCYDYPSVEFGVVRYMAMIKQHGTAYLVMERLSGDNLAHLLATQRVLSGQQICLWLKPLLETLQKLHGKEIFHRDISPNNIFLCAPDNPVLMDFGLAREGVRDEVLKSSTLGAGTFIAPEQLTGGYCDLRTDLYALGAVIYLCLHGEAPPPVEARRQGAPLKRLPQPDNISLALQTVSTHCLQLDLQSRPKNAAQILAELTPCWASQNSFSNASQRTIIPDQVNPNPHLSNQILPNPPPFVDQIPLVPPVPEAGFFKKSVKFLLWAGIAAGGFFAYQNYAENQEKINKQERRLFAEAQSLGDFKAYLEQCQICENKQDATAKIAQVEHEQQVKQEKQEKKKQEHLSYIQAQTIDDLKAYLANCEFCQDGKKAESELKQKMAAEEKVKAEAEAANKPSLLDQVTQPILDSAIEVLQDAKKPSENDDTKVQTDTELKRQQEAEAKARADAELKAEIEAEARAEKEARAKAEADAKVKSDVENAIRRSTGIDITEIQRMLDANKK